jgi:hypothetical protein
MIPFPEEGDPRERGKQPPRLKKAGMGFRAGTRARPGDAIKNQHHATKHSVWRQDYCGRAARVPCSRPAAPSCC